MKIAIIGLGYVGLPLSLQFARSGVNVLGLDTDQLKIVDVEFIASLGEVKPKSVGPANKSRAKL